MSKQKVSTVDGREVKFFATRKEAREFNRKEGTKGVYEFWYAFWYGFPYPNIKEEDKKYRWFVFLDTKPVKQGKGVVIPNVAGQPVKFFPTRHAARQYYWMYKGFPAKYLDLHKIHVPYEGNVNNYRWFVYI